MARGFEGWVAVLPELNGWGSSAFREGFYVFADSEGLRPNKEFVDKPDKIVYGRALKASSRVNAGQSPGGPLQFQFRSDDCLPVFMAHFQNFLATSLGGTDTGTARYEFTPVKSEPDWTGNTFGSGTYKAPVGDMYTVGVVKKISDDQASSGSTAMWFKSGIVGKLDINAVANEDVKATAEFMFYDLDAGTGIGAALNPDNAVFGSYSAKPAFQSWVGTCKFAGASIDLNSLTVTSESGHEKTQVLGKKNPSKYPMGRNRVSGEFAFDVPKDALKYVGSMTGDREFSLSATFFNSTHDYFIVDMPLCKYKDFELNLAGENDRAMTIPYEAYESADGGTAPLKITVQTTGMGTVFNRI